MHKTMRRLSSFGLIFALFLAAACASKPPPQRAKAPVGEPVPSATGLEKALEDYQAIAAKGGWEHVPEAKLQKGDTGEAVASLRRRLIVTGDLSKSKTTDVYDDELEQAVLKFQERHGLDPDATVGKETLAALNVPVEERIHQIKVNLARRAEMPKETADRFVVVNIPDFRLRVIDHGKRVLGMKAISTDSGGSEIDPATIDWKQVSATNPHMRIVQHEGAGNSLGRIKFMFPNPYDVYLHDTPMKKFFERNMRALSHGCVRVEHPLDLAELLMDDNPTWTRAKLQKSIDSGRNQDIPLSAPVPVHIIYRTAWVDEKGAVNFRDDVYGRDAGEAAEVAPAGKSF